ncbi:MAG: ABC transporter permease [Campylobacterales bacterium]
MIAPMLNEAWSALWANRLRSFLTMLGMMIGVGAVILMSAIGEGSKQTINDSIAAMGSNLFIVLSGSTTSGGARAGFGSSPTLTLKDAAAIAELPGVAAVAPGAMGTVQMIYGSNNWSARIGGSTTGFFEVREWSVEKGYPFSDADVRNASRVVVLGQTVASNLFGDEDPVGKTIRIKQSPYTVVGVLAKKGQSMMGDDQDDTAIVPITTGQRNLFGAQFKDSVRMIMVKAQSEDIMPKVENSITELLRERHRIRSGADDDFSVRNLSAVLATSAEAANVMSMLLGAIASISLLVGGIGIMNIMLVSVTERTREIGIRIAIGAREKDILMQFLMEAVMISLIGCLIGVGIGVGGAFLVQMIFETAVVITQSSIIIAFLVATGVGVFFGFYPARKAAKLEPIEALRYQ